MLDTNVFLSCAVLISLLMGSVWLMSLPLRDVSIVDIAWGLGFVLIAAWCYVQSSHGARSFWLVTITTVWGVRLSTYLAWRNLGHGEDFRYRAMREKIGARFWWVSLFVVFGVQGLVMWVVSLPVQSGMMAGNQTMHGLSFVGVVLWGIGFAFESIGDYQMARFKATRSSLGQVMDRGLWRYTRHPNYFGDFLVWWGCFFVSVHTWQSTWIIVSPLLMSFLLLKVSGVALLERSMRKRSPEYVEYIRRTSSFFPWPPTA